MKPLRTPPLLMLCLLWAGFVAPAAQAGPGLAGADVTLPLPILSENYPRVLVFRDAERGASSRDVAAWVANLRPYEGIIGKAGDERIIGRNENLASFNELKRSSPGTMVLVHYLFDGRNRDQTTGNGYFAGHWLHNGGSSVRDALPAGEAVSVVHLANPGVLEAGQKKGGQAMPDVHLCQTQERGKPDWSRCEAAAVLEVNAQQSTVTLRRAQYGSMAQSFAPGQAYLAPIVSHPKADKSAEEGNKSRKLATLWRYNLTPECPRNAQGETAIQVYARDLGSKFSGQGEFAKLDGVAFDVFNLRLATKAKADPDFDGDGKPDSLAQFEQRLTVGRTEFVKALRAQMGPDKLIVTDGWDRDEVRDFMSLTNGMENEGWPDRRDLEMRQWSSGLSRVQYWSTRSYARNRLLYFVYKFLDDSGRSLQPDNINRLFMAGAQFAGAAVTNITQLNTRGKKHSDGEAVFFDEAVKGKEMKVGWLGDPLQPPQRLARSFPNLLDKGVEASIVSPAGSVSRAERDAVSVKGSAEAVRFALKDLAPAAGQLTVFVSLRSPSTAEGQARHLKLRMLDARSGKVLAESYGMVDGQDFETAMSINDASATSVRTEIEVAGAAPVVVASLSAHAAPDAVARRFEHGLVLANPGSTPFNFDLARLAPNTRLRQISGVRGDGSVNNGKDVGASISLTHDAIFLDAP